MATTNFRVFEMFKVEEKIQELKELAQRCNLDVLNGANVVIAVPSLDESGRSIEMADKDLYNTQKKDAYELAEFIILDTKSCMIDIIFDAKKASEVLKLTSRPIEYVLFLHEFVDSERDYILKELSKTCYATPQAIELY